MRLRFVLAGVAFSFATAQAATYKVVYSADAGLCAPLAGLYSRLSAERKGALADFEATAPQRFAEADLTPVPGRAVVVSGEPSVTAFEADLFGDGRNRTLVLREAIGDHYRYSQPLILKPGADYREVLVPLADQPGVVYREVDDTVVDRAAARALPPPDETLSIRLFQRDGVPYLIANAYKAGDVQLYRPRPAGRDLVCRLSLLP